jgi:hypothetical protein
MNQIWLDPTHKRTLKCEIFFQSANFNESSLIKRKKETNGEVHLLEWNSAIRCCWIMRQCKL